MAWFSDVELQNRGDQQGLILQDENGVTAMMVLVWMDRERRYVIYNVLVIRGGATICTTMLASGEPRT